jgi:hypothetical protein
MKKIYLSVMLLGLMSAVPASAELDLGSKMLLRQSKIELPAQLGQDETAKAIRKKMGISGQHCLATAILKDGETAEELKAEGANVYYQRNNIVFLTAPINDIERLAELPSVKQMQLARKMSPKMMNAIPASNVDKIHAGQDLPQAYTGKGVVTAIVDGGMDPNHVNFFDEDGKSRIKWLLKETVNTTTGSVSDAWYGDAADIVDASGPISAFTTDDNTTFHGAHTMGIMAGSYRGDATVATKLNYYKSENQVKANPYYGIAYESDIVATCGDLYDDVIAFGVAASIDYAVDYLQRPCVINLSLGSNDGAHDPNSTMGQVLREFGKDAIICVAAGNEGDLPICINKTFTADDNSVSSIIDPYYFSGVSGTYANCRYGTVSIYSNDETEFEVQAFVYNTKRGTVTFSTPYFGNQEGGAQYYASSSSYQSSDADIINNQFGTYFNGYVGIGSNIDSATGRYYAKLDYYTTNTRKNSSDQYVIGFTVKGKENQTVYCYCDGTYTALASYGLTGFTDGSTNGTISDMACADNILVVGSYNTCADYPCLDGSIRSYEDSFPVGEVSAFSSYGTLYDGTNLPHVLAPGAAIISSYSKYYIDNEDNYMTEDYLTAKCSDSNRDHYWGNAIGTSMSCPYVAGSIALWLEADPTLNIDDVKSIIAATSVKDEYTAQADPVQVGYGKFDAYAGLKEVLRRQAGVSDVKVDDSRLMVTSAGKNLFNVFLAGQNTLNAALYNTQGQIVAKQSGNGDEMVFDANGVTAGLYILSVNGQFSQRVIVK